jgi:hypothetical protein
MQDVDGPAHVQGLAEPAGERGARVEAQADRGVMCAEGRDRVSGHRRGRRHLGQRAPVRAPEPERAIGPARDLIPLLVDGAVMTTAEESKVRQRRRAALRPVPEMMALTEGDATAREAAALVPVLEDAP